MNSEAAALQAETVIFPSKVENTQISEIETTEISRLKIEETKTIYRQTRFAGLKKSLRKRSANIL